MNGQKRVRFKGVLRGLLAFTGGVGGGKGEGFKNLGEKFRLPPLHLSSDAHLLWFFSVSPSTLPAGWLGHIESGILYLF